MEIIADFEPGLCFLQSGKNDIVFKLADITESGWEDRMASQLHVFALVQQLVQSFSIVYI